MFSETIKYIEHLEEQAAQLRDKQQDWYNQIHYLKQERADAKTEEFKLLDEAKELRGKLDLTTDQVLGPWSYAPQGDDYSGGPPLPCLLYHDCYYITIYENEYSLLLENHEYTSQCLRELEEMLADWMLSERVIPYCELRR